MSLDASVIDTLFGLPDGTSQGNFTRRRLSQLIILITAHAEWAVQLTPDAPIDLQEHFRRHRAQTSSSGLPTCPGCRRTTVTDRRSKQGDRVCETCVARESVTECSVCGQMRRNIRGKAYPPMCASCRRPRAKITCTTCGKLRNGVGASGAFLCSDCKPRSLSICQSCGVEKRMYTHIQGKRVCALCYRRVLATAARCGRCGQRRILSEIGRDGQPCCAGCAGIHPRYACRRCGSEEHYGGRLCHPCQVRAAGESISDTNSQLMMLWEHLARLPNPATQLVWVRRADARETLLRLASGNSEISHEVLDQLEDRGPIRHLRALLIDAHVLPPTDVRLRAHEAWVQHWRASTPCASAVIQYASWSHLKRLRKAAQVSPLTPAQVSNARSELKALDHLELWLQAQGKTIITMSQHDFDAYSSVARTVPLRAFFSWAKQTLHLNVHVPIKRRTDPASVISKDQRISIVTAMLTDTTTDVAVRLSTLLVAIYGAELNRVHEMRKTALHLVGGALHAQIGTVTLPLPAPVAQLALDQQCRRPESPWLFPGRYSERPGSSRASREYVRRFGVTTRQLMVAARMDVASALPASLMSDSLGIAIATALRYARVSGGTWSDAPIVFTAHHDTAIPTRGAAGAKG